jgi:hypothetical protein
MLKKFIQFVNCENKEKKETGIEGFAVKADNSQIKFKTEKCSWKRLDGKKNWSQILMPLTKVYVHFFSVVFGCFFSSKT